MPLAGWCPDRCNSCSDYCFDDAFRISEDARNQRNKAIEGELKCIFQMVKKPNILLKTLEATGIEKRLEALGMTRGTSVTVLNKCMRI